MKMATPDTAEMLDRAEVMRSERRIQECLKTVERVLAETPNHPRALLLRSRLHYESGSLPQAIEGVRRLDGIVGEREMQLLVTLLERLNDERNHPRAPAFATESMAKLLTQQGYFLEALEVYRQLLEVAPDKSELWEEIARLKTVVAVEGSREATKERVERELETWERWLRDNRRGS
jgi:tetratricopeptide (TPR) repeat protein